MTKLICFLLALLLSGNVCAEATGKRFTRFAGFELEKINLIEIRKKLGVTPLTETGDAGDYEAKICYNTNQAVVSFLSGELGGDEHELLGFSLVSLRHQEQSCADYPKQYLPKKLEIGGLHLGMTKKEFEKKLTKQVNWRDSEGSLEFVSKQLIRDIDYDVVVNVIGVFDGNDRLKKLSVWKSTTN